MSCVPASDSRSGLEKGVGVGVRFQVAVLDFVSDRWA